MTQHYSNGCGSSVRRMPPEWEGEAAVLMALPHADTDWAYILPRAEEQYREIVSTLTRHGVRVALLCADAAHAAQLMSDADTSLLHLIEMDFNDTWTRDYGPIAVEEDGGMRAFDFGFNGWGLKFASDRDNLVNARLAERGVILPQAYSHHTGFVLEGGSIESDGEGTILTTSRCLCSPNRNGYLSKAEATEALQQLLGASHVLWLDYGALEGDDTDSHIDTLARLAPSDTIIFTGCRDVEDTQFEELLHMRAQLTLLRTSEGNPYNLVELPLPSPIYDEEGQRLPATYANYLVTPGKVFCPTYNQPANDTLAMQMLSIAYPEHEIVGIPCTTLLYQHGSLHCATMQLHTGTFKL